MLLHILRKDLKRKRTMNIILFLFILLATTFLAASVNNFVTITGGRRRRLPVLKRATAYR